MPPLPILVVVERESYWLAECQRQLVGQADVQACSPGAEVADRIESLRPTVVILEAVALQSQLPHIVARLGRVTRIVVIVPFGGESGEWWLRELGAEAVFQVDHPRDEAMETCGRLLRVAANR